MLKLALKWKIHFIFEVHTYICYSLYRKVNKYTVLKATLRGEGLVCF